MLKHPVKITGILSHSLYVWGDSQNVIFRQVSESIIKLWVIRIHPQKTLPCLCVSWWWNYVTCVLGQGGRRRLENQAQISVWRRGRVGAKHSRELTSRRKSPMPRWTWTWMVGEEWTGQGQLPRSRTTLQEECMKECLFPGREVLYYNCPGYLM